MAFVMLHPTQTCGKPRSTPEVGEQAVRFTLGDWQREGRCGKTSRVAPKTSKRGAL